MQTANGIITPLPRPSRGSPGVVSPFLRSHYENASIQRGAREGHFVRTSGLTSGTQFDPGADALRGEGVVD
jgi:hypothetical protein